MRATAIVSVDKKPVLQTKDFICLRCGVQATREADHVCGICKAIGKVSDSVLEFDFWKPFRRSVYRARKYLFGAVEKT